MFRKLAILAILSLVGCGADEPSQTDTVQTKSEPEPKPEVTEVEQVQDKSVPGHALAVTELPLCNDDNLHQLVYLTSKEQFYTCEDEWNVIEIVAESPDVQSDALWHDTETNRYWFYRGMTNNYMGCGDSGGFHTPELEDIQEAIDNGLLAGLDVAIYYAGNKYIETDYPTVERTDYTGQLYGFSLCWAR